MMGKRCRIETIDGSIRYEKVTSIGSRKIQIRGGETIEYPEVLYFDHREGDGVDLRILLSVWPDEEGVTG